jgi:hypothetical protein
LQKNDSALTRGDDSMKMGMRLSCIISIALVSASVAYADSLHVDLVNFRWAETKTIVRNGSAEGGAEVFTDPITGVALNIQSIVYAKADIGKWDFGDWYEDAKGGEGIFWDMELMLDGDDGASGEVIGRWDLWLAYSIGAVPDDMLLEATNASIETEISIIAEQDLCIPLFPCIRIPWPLAEGSGQVGDMIIWLGAAGGGKEAHRSFSLGTYDVGDHFYLMGIYNSLAWADEEAFGMALSWGYSNFDLRFNVKGLPLPDPPIPVPPDPPSPTIPEPTSLILLASGLGVLGLGLWHKRR